MAIRTDTGTGLEHSQSPFTFRTLILTQDDLEVILLGPGFEISDKVVKEGNLLKNGPRGWN
jgi:hypothetical protein